MLEAGATIDRYVIEGQLGEGGLAEVYQVRHTQLDTLHALKIIKGDRKAVRDRLIREGKLQGGLRHPNIVAITDLVDVEGAPALVMELVDGPNLEVWLNQHDPDLGQLELLFRGIVAGVHAAHEHNMVHRDLKPENVLLASIDGQLIPKVADFGLAKSSEDSEQNFSATQTGLPMGTPSFMSPEQIRSAKHVDLRTDIFALGCILYRMVCRRLPFVGKDMLELFNRVAKGEYPHPREIRPDLPERFEAAIRGCLQVNVEYRISDCPELLSVLAGESSGPAPQVSAGVAPPIVPESIVGVLSTIDPQENEGNFEDKQTSNSFIATLENIPKETRNQVLFAGAGAVAGAGVMGTVGVVVVVLIIFLIWGTSGRTPDPVVDDTQAVEAVEQPVDASRPGPEPSVEPEPEGCTTGLFQNSYGWIKERGRLRPLPKVGDTRKLYGERPVYAGAPQATDETTVSKEELCRLSKGATVKVTADPVVYPPGKSPFKARFTWLKVGPAD